MKVLIVDDDEQIRQTLGAFLDKTGWQVKIAASFEEAIELLDDTADVVLSDIKLGRKSGLDLLRRVKENFPFTDVILMTGYSDLEDSIEALHSRAFAYLRKPFELSELNRKLIEAARSKALKKIENHYKNILETEVRHKTKQLQVEMEKFQTIFTAVPSLLAVVDKNMNIVDGNRMFEQYTGWEIVHAIGRRICDVLSCGAPECRAADIQNTQPVECTLYHLLKQVQEGPRAVAHEQLSLTIREQSGDKSRVFRVACCLLPESQGAEPLTLLLLDDVTHEKELEFQLSRSSRLTALGEMASGVVHELSQPLNGIGALIQLFGSRLSSGRQPPVDELSQMCGNLLHEVNRMGAIIDNLRLFYRSGKIPENKQPVDVKAVYRSSMGLLWTQIVNRGIVLEEQFSDGLPLVMADSLRLEQVFLNLLINARDALDELSPGIAGSAPDERKLILVTAKHHNLRNRPGVLVEVTDNGAGIAPEIQDKIFDPFYSTKEPEKGTGLGLAISLRIIKDFDGTLEAESIPGGLTSFRFWLPACQDSTVSAERI